MNTSQVSFDLLSRVVRLLKEELNFRFWNIHLIIHVSHEIMNREMCWIWLKYVLSYQVLEFWPWNVCVVWLSIWKYSIWKLWMLIIPKLLGQSQWKLLVQRRTKWRKLQNRQNPNLENEIWISLWNEWWILWYNRSVIGNIVLNLTAVAPFRCFETFYETNEKVIAIQREKIEASQGIRNWK